MPHRLLALLPLFGVSATMRHSTPISQSNLDWQKVIRDLLFVVTDIETLVKERMMDPEKSATIPDLMCARDRILRSIFHIRAEFQERERDPDS
jgi:hypothetical protein